MYNSITIINAGFSILFKKGKKILGRITGEILNTKGDVSPSYVRYCNL